MQCALRAQRLSRIYFLISSAFARHDCIRYSSHGNKRHRCNAIIQHSSDSFEPMMRIVSARLPGCRADVKTVHGDWRHAEVPTRRVGRIRHLTNTLDHRSPAPEIGPIGARFTPRRPVPHLGSRPDFYTLLRENRLNS
jgi:hypothetical protein